jgi:hypothetical protein
MRQNKVGKRKVGERKHTFLAIFELRYSASISQIPMISR